MEPEQERESPGDDYQRWLDDLAGAPVGVVWVIALWMVLGLAIFVTFDSLGVESDAPAGTVVAVLSAAYWLWAVPRWARRKGERRRSRDL